jgi:hypothetical protein
VLSGRTRQPPQKSSIYKTVGQISEEEHILAENTAEKKGGGGGELLMQYIQAKTKAVDLQHVD